MPCSGCPDSLDSRVRSPRPLCIQRERGERIIRHKAREKSLVSKVPQPKRGFDLALKLAVQFLEALGQHPDHH